MILQERKDLLLKNREIVMTVFKEQEEIAELFSKQPPGTIPDKLKFPRAITYLDALQGHQYFHKIKPYLSENTIHLLTNSKLYNFKDRGSHLGEMPKPFQAVLVDISNLESKWEVL